MTVLVYALDSIPPVSSILMMIVEALRNNGNGMAFVLSAYHKGADLSGSMLADSV